MPESSLQAMNFDNAVVADLAWCVYSPPLVLEMQHECRWFDDAWYRDFYRQIEPALLVLDREPRRLIDRLAAEKDRRLGNYFETLWHHAVDLHPRYTLVAQNLQVIEAGETLGEFDFLLYDKEARACLHWELAIKFYLGYGDLRRPQSWIGPRKTDRLDRKLWHLQTRQSRLRRHPLARQALADRGISIRRCGVILKGCLFYPWGEADADTAPVVVNPSHQRGAWMTLSQFSREGSASERYRVLIRSGWLSGIPTGEDRKIFTLSALLDHFRSHGARLPAFVQVLEGKKIKARLFVVDDAWPESPT